MASRIANLKNGQRADYLAAASFEAATQSEAADLLNVSRSAVQRARIVLEDGPPELVEAVEQGKIAVSAAAKIAALPPEQQPKAMVAAKLATLGQGRPELNAQICAFSQPDAAGLLNVSRRAVQHARTVLEDGSPELIEAEPQAQSVTSVTASVTGATPAKPQKQPSVTSVTDVTGNRPGGPTRNDHD